MFILYLFPHCGYGEVPSRTTSGVERGSANRFVGGTNAKTNAHKQARTHTHVLIYRDRHTHIYTQKHTYTHENVYTHTDTHINEHTQITHVYT